MSLNLTKSGNVTENILPVKKSAKNKKSVNKYYAFNCIRKKY